MLNEAAAISAVFAVAFSLLAAWLLGGSRLEGAKNWIDGFSLFLCIRSDIGKFRSSIRRLARTVSSLQKEVSDLRLQLKAAEAEIDAGPSINAFCVLRERVDRLEKGWITANSIKRILDANEKNLKKMQSEMELLYRKVDGIGGRR